MTDYEIFINFFSMAQVSYSEFNETEYIHEGAVNAGAVKTISVRDQVDFAFDSNGNYLGSSTDQINSFEPKPSNSMRFIIGDVE